MNDTVDLAVSSIRHKRFHTRSQAKRDKHADAQAKHRAKLRDNGAPSRADIAAVTLAVVLLICKTYPRDRDVKIIRDMIELELRKAEFDDGQIKLRLDRMVDNCDRDLARWRECRAWFEQRRKRMAPP
jgi:hypothetical protein